MKNSSKTEISEIIGSVFESSPAVGASIISGNDREIKFESSFGSVCANSKLKVNSNTVFDIQSITKVVATASLLERFEKQEKIALENFAAQYVPELRGSGKGLITIRDLLLHQSGMSDDDLGGEFYSAEDLWAAMFEMGTRFEPGSSLEYADVGYRILGLCLERLGGASLEELCRKEVWSPLKMTQTTYQPSAFLRKNLAGHSSSYGAVDDKQDRLLGRPTGCDGVFSSARDLATFCQWWLRRLADVNYRTEFFKVGAGVTQSGWSFYESLGLGRKVYGWEQHDRPQSYLGERHSLLSLEKAGGAGTFICLRPERSDFIVYLTNHGKPDPFSTKTWNTLVDKLRVRQIAQAVLEP